MGKFRILLVDDHPVVRNGLREMLSRRPEWEVCGEAATGREAISACERLKPDLAIVDISMPAMTGLDAVRQIRQTQPQIEILILSVHESDRLVREALAAGARGYMLKTDIGDDLVAAVDALRQHKPFFNAQVSEQLLRGIVEGGSSPKAELSGLLSAREWELVRILAEGKSNKEAADALHLSVKTIETHRAHIMAKLEIHSFGELVRYAIRNRIIEA